MKTGWVKTPKSKTGRDHLGAQGPCINMYGRLLPGITNVTDRARYYTFYPWFLWSSKKRYNDVTLDFLVDKYRRADCLFTLIAARHSRKLKENEDQHGAGMVGRDTLIPALSEVEESGVLKLSTYATRRQDTPDRYFKNKFGGLGQYYAGPLLDLGVMDGSSKEGYNFTHERGTPLAEALDTGVNRELFFDTLDNDTVTLDLLDELSDFCPCRLVHNRAERCALQVLFFDRNDIYGDEGRQRRETLILLLYLIGELESKVSDPPEFDHFFFRSAVYSGCLVHGVSWNIPTILKETCQKWKIYETNELFSIAMQGIFWFALKLLKEQPTFETAEAFAEWFSSSEIVKGTLNDSLDTVLSQAITAARKILIPLSEWEDPRHEITLGKSILDFYKSGKYEAPDPKMLEAALSILINLSARAVSSEKPYGNFDFSDDFFFYYPLNLNILRTCFFVDWGDLTIRDVIFRIVSSWAFETHFRVALRKLRYDSRDTFQVRPTETGLKWVADPQPVFTNPRFNQAIRMLWDIGAIVKKESGKHYNLTDLGRNLLDKTDAL